MKVLAIRGQNLASLAGSFDVDFTVEPLLSAPVYLIAGPTGAGKSSLLDALCLALYGTCPRLTGAQGHFVDVGDKVLPGNNPLSLVRRGTTHAMAEAEIIGQDGRRYRCRWSASRKRDKLEHGFRPVEQTLWDVAAEQQIGRTLVETRQEIISRVGLDFDQFSRAVLLAQNQFAHFLKANPTERAQLLEQLTHTGIYRRLSIQAHERARQVRDLWQQAQARLGEHSPLPDDERATLQAQHDTVAATLQQLDLDLETLQQAARWLNTEQSLHQALIAAQQATANAQAMVAAAAPRRQELIAIERSQAARPLLTELNRAQAAVHTAAASVTNALQQRQTAEQSAAQHRLAVAAAEATAIQHQTAWRDAGPTLQQARRLDIELAGAEHECRQAAATLSQTTAQVAAHQQQLVALRRDQQQWQDRRQQALAATAEFAAIGSLAEQWSVWQGLLDQWAGHLAAWQQARIELRAAGRALEVATSHRNDMSAQVALHADRADQAGRGVTAAEAAVARYQPAELSQQREQTQIAWCNLQAAQLAGERAATCRADLAMAQRRHSEYSQKRDDAARALPTAEAEELRLQGELAGMEKQSQLAQAALNANAASLRRQLQPDQACPVCGSLDHPWAEHPALSTLLQAQQNAVEQTRLALRNTQMECDRLRSRLRTHGEEADLWAQRLQAAEAQNHAAQQAWQAALALCPMPADSSLEHLQSHTQALAAQREQLEQQWQAATQAEQTLAQGRRQQQDRQQELEQARERLRHAEDLLRAAHSRQQEAEHRLHASGLLQQAASRQIDQTLGDGSGAEWAGDPGAFVAKLEEQRAVWQAAQAALRGAEQQLAELAAGVLRGEEALQQASEQQLQLTNQHQHRLQILHELQQQRLGYFSGQPVEPIAAALQAADTQAQQHWDHCRTLWEQAEQAAAAAQAHHAAAETALAAAAAAETAAQAAWRQWLDSVGGDEGCWRERLTATPAWIDAERAALHRLDQQLAERTALLQEHLRRLDQHRSLRLTLLDAGAVADQLTSLQLARQQQRDAATEIRARLQIDDQARSRQQQEQVQLAELQRNAAVWEDLRAVIGSADGARFSRFAQQLTMASLLDFANAHLAEFAPRYRLAALDGDGLDFHIIDGDMADETRTIHSLSGGESFLVSLALALGLASLSADRVRIESLFIDEGFGSLDSDTLQVAVAALERLQASGRTVGIISHVTELAEQIAVQIQVRRVGHGASHIQVRELTAPAT